MFGDSVTVTRRVVVLSAIALGTAFQTACGPGVADKVVSAMQGCVALRNPLFKAGQAEQALALPLPPAVDSLATQTAYAFGFNAYQQLADMAETQAELTCALELGARYEDADVRVWLKKYLRSPDAPVAAHAQRLLDKQTR
ncbi:hypothetical protein [Gemmatimonas phototrophica]|uniref:Uncharacterized protein n=1 Tax=Gemmatimonas phototrophica TaxID=1379270 RepID=A0A143BIW4_9BACT|nr:hypothetical protein [Gemmatimonas phototrophica]AMW04410.1 hypothetical protein GEMMAAP_05280 [Gemmatimonas phototrophica]